MWALKFLVRCRYLENIGFIVLVDSASGSDEEQWSNVNSIRNRVYAWSMPKLPVSDPSCEGSNGVSIFYEVVLNTAQRKC